MATKQMTMPDGMLNRYITAKKTVYPIPLDPETDEPLYTDIEWVLKDISHQVRVRIATLESKAKAKLETITPITEEVTFGN